MSTSVCALIADEHGEIVDHVVEMRRLPDELRLASLATRGADLAPCVEHLADHARRRSIATLRRVARSIAPGLLPRSRSVWASSLDEFSPFVGTVLDRAVYDAVANDARDYVAGPSALLRRTAGEGDPRRPRRPSRRRHLLPRRRPARARLPRIRRRPALRRRARRSRVPRDGSRAPRAARPRTRYCSTRINAAAVDRWPTSLEHHYIAYRALVRAEVACLRMGADNAAAARAHDLFDLCARHLAHGRVRLVLIGGAPATGKTMLAGALVAAPAGRCCTPTRCVSSSPVLNQLPAPSRRSTVACTPEAFSERRTTALLTAAHVTSPSSEST